MSKLIPQTINGYISVAAVSAAAGMAAYLSTLTAAPPTWAVVANAVITAVALVFKGVGVGGAK